MLGKNRFNPPTDNKLKHCREWLETTLLVKSDAKTLSSAGLLAGEIILCSTAGLWSVIALLNLQGPPAQRLAAVLKSILPWFPLLALCLLLSLAAAHMAQWGERRYGRGRMAAAAASVPMAPIILGSLLTQPLFAAAPLLAPLVIWAAAELWWQIFLYLLRRLAAFDYWAQLELESKNTASDACYDLNFHREHLETKKTALMERKLRWKAMADDENPENPQEGQAEALSTNQALSPARSGTWLRPQVIVPLAVCCLLALSGILSHQMDGRKGQVPVPEAAAALPMEHPRVVFWYQAVEPEASLLQDLITAYNERIDDPVTTPAAVSYTHLRDIALEIFHAQLSDSCPDIMLLPTDLALQLHTSWNPSALESESAGYCLPLWPDRPWRQRLALVISPNTQFPRQAQSFAAYLFDQLNRD